MGLNAWVQVSGKVLYNGHAFNEFVPEGTSAYVDQVDTHIPGASPQLHSDAGHSCHVCASNALHSCFPSEMR